MEADLGILGPVVAIDLETTGLDVFNDKILDIFLTDKEDNYINLSGDVAYRLQELPKTTTLVFHNFKYDLNILYRNGVDLRSYTIIDTMLLHHLIDENKSHALSDIIKEYYNDDYKDIFWNKYKTYEEAPISDKVTYASKDVMYTLKLYNRFLPTLNKPLVEHVHRLAKALFDTEINGIKLDLPYIVNLGSKLKEQINLAIPEMQSLVKEDIELLELRYWEKELDKRKTDKGKSKVQKPTFSFDSSTQLRDLLYNRLKLPTQFNEKTKAISTDDKSLSVLHDLHPLIVKLRKYRELNKLYGTYIEGLLERAKDDRIFPSFNINGTNTGRISHSNPNMGNIPADNDIRGMFLADSGHVIISADYGQLEVCLAAHFSQDKNLLKIVLEDISQHDITANELKIPRDAAKTLNFAMQYRCSHYKVSKMLSISEEEAKLIWNKYWETYKGLKRLMDQCDKQVNLGVPIESPFGRLRHFEKVRRQPWDKAYRQAYNALIQGTGGDLTNRAYYLIHEHLKQSNSGYGMFTVHDEILIASKTTHIDESKELLEAYMKQVGKEINLTVPLKVKVSQGAERWMK